MTKGLSQKECRDVTVARMEVRNSVPGTTGTPGHVGSDDGPLCSSGFSLPDRTPGPTNDPVSVGICDSSSCQPD